MVVLEGANASIPMLTIGNNQYLQPDYLTSNPSMVSLKVLNFSSSKKTHKFSHMKISKKSI